MNNIAMFDGFHRVFLTNDANIDAFSINVRQTAERKMIKKEYLGTIPQTKIFTGVVCQIPVGVYFNKASG